MNTSFHVFVHDEETREHTNSSGHIVVMPGAGAELDETQIRAALGAFKNLTETLEHELEHIEGTHVHEEDSQE